MAIKDIVTTTNNTHTRPAVLTTKCNSVEKIDAHAKQVIADLKDTVKANDTKAAGLSAPQIGENIRIFLAREFKYAEDDEEESVVNHIIVNPVITESSKRKAVWWEGCLSIPNVWGLVERAKKIKLEGLDENGNKIKIKASGDFARVLQHELDHLNGVLFTTKVIGKTMTEEELDKLLKSRLQAS